MDSRYRTLERKWVLGRVEKERKKGAAELSALWTELIYYK